MLKHEDIPQTQPPPAAQVRVTPEELAAAITALQIRKEGQPGTIAIGDAVEELGLDVTPEEVLAEVQARRRAAPRKKHSTVWDRAVLALGLSGILLGLVIDGSSLRQVQYQQVAQPASVSGVTPVPIHIETNLLVSTSSGKLTTFSEVGDGQPVRCNLSKQNGQIAFYQWTPGMTTQKSWMLIKHHNKVYIRGWTASSSAEQVKTDGIEVRSSPNGAYDTPITLPLEDFKATSYGDYGSLVRFRATDVSLDQHTNEKW